MIFFSASIITFIAMFNFSPFIADGYKIDGYTNAWWHNRFWTTENPNCPSCCPICPFEDCMDCPLHRQKPPCPSCCNSGCFHGHCTYCTNKYNKYKGFQQTTPNSYPLWNLGG